MDPDLLASQKPADLDLNYFQNRIYYLGTLRIKPLFEGIYSSDSIFAGNKNMSRAPKPSSKCQN